MRVDFSSTRSRILLSFVRQSRGTGDNRMSLRIVGFIALLCTALPVAAQVDQQAMQDAYRKLREKQAARGPSTLPTTRLTRPATAQKLEKRLTLKSTAPDIAKKWFNNLDSYKAQETGRLQAELDKGEQQLKALYHEKLPTESYYVGTIQMTHTEASAKERNAQQIKQTKERNALLRQQVLKLKNDRTYIWIPDANLEVGSFGRLPTALKVLQVVSKSELIVTVGDSGKKVWLSGFDTSKTTDDSVVTYPKPVLFSRTKTYQTVLGGTVTCLLAEPFDPLDWVSVVEVPAGSGPPLETSKTYQDARSLLLDIPEDDRPQENETWQPIHTKLSNEALPNEVLGCDADFSYVLQAVHLEGQSKISLAVPEFVQYGATFRGSLVEAELNDFQLKKLARMKPGDLVRIQGKIDKVEIKSAVTAPVPSRPAVKASTGQNPLSLIVSLRDVNIERR
jgi:hypothetical protein